MLKITQLVLGVGVFLVAWVAALQRDLTPDARWVVQAFPLFALVSFGLYSVMVIGWSLATFPLCPEAAASLQEEVQDMRRELVAKEVLPAEPKKGK